ncbi:MAG TPA: NAD(P)H-quinone oxidoreductase [Rhodospirillaceae bacterium]|nr:NAD(P)H-quinone oxidoreductase [Rhodospirillaceae bacterium]
MSLPLEMKCIETAADGTLSVGRRPLPKPAAGEILIEVEAAGVNRPDIIQRQGLYPPPPGASDILGLEVAGTVVALADDVEGHRLGDKVCALVTGGGYAQYCTAAALLCLPWPKGYDAVQAAALPETFFTVWHNLFQRGHLLSGERFLVHGGSSGIGTTAIQIAKAFGAEVFTTAGTDEKCAACRKLGADLAINYRTEDFVSAISTATKGRGVDLILDMVGGDYLARNIKCLAPEGRHVSIAFLNGPKAEVNFLPVMLKRLTLTGSTLRPQSVANKASIAIALADNIWPLLDQGTLSPLISAQFPLEQASEAHHLMESSAHIGKIILTV